MCTSHHPGQGIDQLALTGGGAHLPGLGQYLSSASRLPAALGDALAGVRLGRAVPAATVQVTTTARSHRLMGEAG